MMYVDPGKRELASAQRELREAYRLLAAGVGPKDSRTQAAAKTLIEFLESTGETAKAKDFRDALTNMEAPPKP